MRKNHASKAGLHISISLQRRKTPRERESVCVGEKIIEAGPARDEDYPFLSLFLSRTFLVSWTRIHAAWNLLRRRSAVGLIDICGWLWFV